MYRYLSLSGRVFETSTCILNRTKINQNIGIAFVKLGQYNDAATTFRTIMSEEPNFRTGFNLILCNYALGDRDEMKRSFERLLTVDLKLDNEDKYVASKVLLSTALYKFTGVCLLTHWSLLRCIDC